MGAKFRYWLSWKGLILTAVVVLLISPSIQKGRKGPTRAFLARLPLKTILHAYDRAGYPLGAVQEKVDTLIEAEEKYPHHHVLYHGVHGKRLFFDTLNVLRHVFDGEDPFHHLPLVRLPHPQPAPWMTAQHFAEEHFPSLPIEHKKALLEMLGFDLPRHKAEWFWRLCEGFLSPHTDLTWEEEEELQQILRSSFHTARLSVDEGLQKISLALHRLAEHSSHRHPKYAGALTAWRQYLSAHDLRPEVRAWLLSVNLSLFGGSVKLGSEGDLEPSPDECTPLIWTGLLPRPNKSKRLHNSLTQLLTRYGIPEAECDTLYKLYQNLEDSDDQLLLQWFVPDHLVDRCLYLSAPYGRPVEHLKMERPSEILKKYRDDPCAIPGFCQLQGRLLLDYGGALNPESGVHVEVYLSPHASSERLEAYLRSLTQWAEEQVSLLERGRAA